MGKQVIWTKQALRKLHEIIEYLQNEVSLQAAINLNEQNFKETGPDKKLPGSWPPFLQKENCPFFVDWKTSPYVLQDSQTENYYRLLLRYPSTSW